MVLFVYGHLNDTILPKAVEHASVTEAEPHVDKGFFTYCLT
jgi:hypothetical protein